MKVGTTRWGAGGAAAALIVVVACAIYPAAGQEATPGGATDKAAPMPEGIAAKFDELMLRLVPAKRKLWDADMKKAIDEVAQTAGLDPGGIKALQAVATNVEDRTQVDFTAKMKETMQQEYRKNPDEFTKGLAMASEHPDEMAAAPDPELLYVRPLDQPAWKEGITRTLTPAQLATWEKAKTGRNAPLDKAIADFVEKQAVKYPTQQGDPMVAQVAEITAALHLSNERDAQLKALAKQATDASMAAWRQAITKSLLSQTEEQRKKTLQNKNYYFRVNEKDAPQKQAVWTDGLAKLLTDADRARLQTVRDSHKTRRLHALGQLVVALMDEKVALTESQRPRLETLLEKQAESQTAFFPNSSNGNYYYYLSPATIYQTANKARREDVQPILDDIQWKHWQAAGHDGNTGDDDEEATPAASPTPASQEASAGEPEDMEQAVSDYLQTRAAARYKQVETVMILQAEDAARIAGLEAPHAARLQTAARGAAETALAAWIPSVEQNTRAEAQGATPENIRQRLANGSRYYYERSDPRNDALWKATVNAEMTPPQQTAWTAERDARSRYNAAAVAGYLLAEFDRKFSLLPEQWDQLAPTLTKAVQDYEPDIRGMFSYNNTPWFLGSYYMFLPLHAIPENDLKALLSREQWERWSGSNEYNNTLRYWDNIRQSHTQRAQQKQP